MAWILLRLSSYQQVAPLVRTGGSRHTGLAAPPHRNIHTAKKKPKKIIVQESGAILLSAECIFPEIFMKEKGSGLRRPSQEVAYCRADYDGFHWWRKWFYVQEKPLPSALGEELDEFVNGLFELPEFCSLESVKHSICSQAQPVSETEFNLYSETEHFWIWVRMQTQPRDYNLWIYFYKKEEDSHDER